MPPLTIAVAGCGPCGLASALLLQRAGHSVTIFERFEVPEPIGSGLMLQPTGLSVLGQLGLARQAIEAGARIERLIGRAGAEGPLVLDVRYSAARDPGQFGIGIHRARLFGLLHDKAVADGIAIEAARQVATTTLLSGNRRRIEFADGASAGPFDLVVDALGSRSPLLADVPPRDLAYGALWGTVDWVDDTAFDIAALEQRYNRAARMVGVLPVGTAPGSSQKKAALFWSLRRDRLADWHDAGLDAWKMEALSLWPALRPLLDQIVSADQLAFARYAHRTLAAPAEPHLVHLGDAWHSTSPQLGQGANMALLDAWALSRALDECDAIPEALEQFVRLRRKHVRLYQALSYLLTPVYQSDGRLLPWLRDRIASQMQRLWPVAPILAAMVSGTIGDPIHRLGLKP